jgi:hypothetical protein
MLARRRRSAVFCFRRADARSKRRCHWKTATDRTRIGADETPGRAPTHRTYPDGRRTAGRVVPQMLATGSQSSLAHSHNIDGKPKAAVLARGSEGGDPSKGMGNPPLRVPLAGRVFRRNLSAGNGINPIPSRPARRLDGHAAGSETLIDDALGIEARPSVAARRGTIASRLDRGGPGGGGGLK